jgi:hypothetical protein
MDVPAGRYRHYKGGEYEVFFVATHSETEEQVVVYRTLYGDRSYWVRPLGMFTETVVVDGAEKPRFELIEAVPG